MSQRESREKRETACSAGGNSALKRVAFASQMGIRKKGALYQLRLEFTKAPVLAEKGTGCNS